MGNAHDKVIISKKRVTHLSLQGGLILQHVDQLSVIDLKQHAGDLACEIKNYYNFKNTGISAFFINL
jgi:hypothetical protein